jgi:hypothetical protein
VSFQSPEQSFSRENISDAGVRVGLGALAEVNRLNNTNFYLWGSQGRAVAAIAYEKGVNHLNFHDIKDCFRPKEGWLDIDFAFAPDEFSWADACTLCENIYDTTRESVILDPHYFLIDDGQMYSSPFKSRNSFVFNLADSIDIQLPNGVIKCAGLGTQLAFLKRPDIVLPPKYEQYMAEYVQRFPEFANIKHRSVDALEYELLLRKHGVEKSIPQFLYHTAVPTELRGNFARIRNLLKGKKIDTISDPPPDKVLNFKSAAPLFW